MRKKVRPIIIDEIISGNEKVIIPHFIEKKSVTGIPAGHVRVIILKDCEGMSGPYKAGDIIDLPDRRFKTLALRGFCAEYRDSKKPNKDR
jgi:hypothetical protein